MIRHRHGLSVAGLALLLGACSRDAAIREVKVRSVDYSFEAPDSLQAGEVAFAFENGGRVPHEVKVIALKPGVTLEQVMRAAKADTNASLTDFVEPTSGILTAKPGATTPGRILVTLQGGRTYVLVCMFQDSDSAPTHDQLGMVRAVKVY